MGKLTVLKNDVRALIDFFFLSLSSLFRRLYKICKVGKKLKFFLPTIQIGQVEFFFIKKPTNKKKEKLHRETWCKKTQVFFTNYTNLYSRIFLHKKNQKTKKKRKNCTARRDAKKNPSFFTDYTNL